MTTPIDPADDGAQMSFDGRMSYGDYLHLDKILSAQHPLTQADLAAEVDSLRELGLELAVR